MRWLSFYILVYLTLGLQTGLRPYIAWRDASPNLLLLVVVFVCINASQESALIGAFILGALQDLFTQTPLGLHAFAYSLLGLLVVRVRLVVHRQHPLTHVSLALVGMLILGALDALQTLLHHPPPGTMGRGASMFFASLLYTLLLAPVVIGVLQRGRRLFAFELGGSSRIPAPRGRRRE